MKEEIEKESEKIKKDSGKEKKKKERIGMLNIYTTFNYTNESHQ